MSPRSRFSRNISRIFRSRIRALRKSSPGRSSQASTCSSASQSTAPREDIHEVVLKIDVTARSENGVHFVVDLSYAGLFGLRNLPEEALQPFLLIEAPRLLFPFARQIIAEAVRARGFPPLLLDPIDFAAAYMAQLQASRVSRANAAAGAGGEGPATPDRRSGGQAMNLARSLGSVGGLTLASRVLGLVRDMLFAQFVGANFASDAFTIAWRMPNMFRALFAEGAFSAAFIPMFNKKVADPKGPRLAAGVAFADDALSVLLPALIVMTLLLELFAWPATYVISAGFHGASREKFAFAVMLSRITFPYLMLISLASLLGGILNSLHKFWVAAAAPILLNVAQIVALVFFHTHEPLMTAQNQAISVTVGGALQLAWLIQACWATGFGCRSGCRASTPDVKRLMKLIARRRRARARSSSTCSCRARSRDGPAAARLGLVHLLCRPTEPASARPYRHRARHRPPSDHFAPARTRRGRAKR